MRFDRPGPVLLAAILLGPSWGCGGGTDRPALSETIPVKGTVTYKGQPLTGGTVEFEPRNAGRNARGAIRPDGTFVLSTSKDGDGAVEDLHRVSVLAGPGDKVALPGKYAQPQTSGLKADVTRDHAEFRFDLR